MEESLHNVRQVQALMIRGERLDLEGKQLTNLTGTAWHRIVGGYPIGDPALVPHQRVMLENLLVDGVRPVWAAVGPSEDMLPDDGLCPTMGRTL
jgi:hypothetical protein